MDKEQARFILRSFRPDGADAGDLDFAEALKLAIENRELGEWLAHERAFDASFAKAMGSVDLPESLREDILACLAVERGDFPQAADVADAAWIGAMASIQPPPGLREGVLAAMDKTVVRETMAKGKISIFRRAAIILAAAAGIALAFYVTREEEPGTKVLASSGIPVEAVRAGFIRTIESPKFDLEKKDPRQVALIQHLTERGLPRPDEFPAGLKNVDGLGCRELEIAGKHGSLICFNLGKDGVVHLVVFRREDVDGAFPAMQAPEFARNDGWSSARWERDGKVYLLMGQMEVSQLSAIF